MKAFFTKPGTRERAMIRTNTIDAGCPLKPVLESDGFIEVGRIQFWKHVFFWWKK